MLKLSRKLDYAILAVSHLTTSGIGQPVSARCLSERTRIPAAILANILKDLTRAGFVRSVRGVHGGYELAVKPESLSVGDLVEKLEGPVKLVECVVLPGDGTDEDSSCTISKLCPIKMPLQRVHEKIHEVLEKLTFDELSAELFVGETVDP